MQNSLILVCYAELLLQGLIAHFNLEVVSGMTQWPEQASLCHQGLISLHLYLSTYKTCVCVLKQEKENINMKHFRHMKW